MTFLRFYRNASPLKTFCVCVLTAACTLSVMGCATWKVPSTAAKPRLSQERMDYLLSRFTSSTGHDTLKTIAHISIDHPTGKYVRKVALLAQRPSSLRIDAIPLFGPPDFFMSTGETLIRVFLPREGTYYIAPATKENLFRFFYIPVPVDHTVALLMGMPPITATDGFIPRGYSEGERDRLDLLSGGRLLQSVWFNETGDIVEIALFDAEGSLLYTVSFGDFISLGERVYPGRLKMTIEDGMKKIYVTITYMDPEISEKEDQALFDVPIPAGVKPRFLN